MKNIGFLIGLILVAQSCKPRPSLVEMQKFAAPTPNAPAKAMPEPVSSSVVETTVSAQIDNRSVPHDDIVQHPERIAAVFHVRRKPEGGPRFREYIVCNESMIARWSVDTSHEQSIVEQESALITDSLQSPLISTLGKDDSLDANAAWSRTLDNPTLLDKWRATLAFDSPKYKPTKTRLAAISASLAAYERTGEPLNHTPSIAFPEKPKP